MKIRKWTFVLAALCLLLSAVPTAAFAGQGPAQQVRTRAEAGYALEGEEETKAQAPDQPEDAPQSDVRNPLLHIPLVLAIMAILLCGFIVWGRSRENR